MQETCDGFTNEEIKNDCIAYNNSIIGYYFTESININQKLKTIPKKIDCLYIFTDGVSETIDFNNLRSPTLVSINPFDFSILNSMSSLTKMIKERKTSFLKISKHLSPKETMPSLSIIGNMNSTVSFLILDYIETSFVGDVNCQNLFLMEARIATTNNQINLENVDFLILSRRSLEYNENLVFKTKQLTYYCDINSQGSVNIGGSGYFASITSNSYQTYNYISTDKSKDLGYIFIQNPINIDTSASDMATQILINLTFLDLSSLFEVPSYNVKETKDTLVMSSNDVSSLTGILPNYQLYYNFDQVNVDKTSLQFNCDENQLYIMTPKGDIDEDETSEYNEESISSNLISTNDNENSDSSNSYTSLNSNSILYGSYTYSKTFSITFFNLRSVSFSYTLSHSIFHFYDNLGSEILSNTASLFFLPYIIYYLSPSYVPVYIKFPIKKRIISPEQLIGVTCGSTAIFFFILFIIIKIVRKNVIKNNFSYYALFLDDINDQKKDIIITNENKQVSKNLQDEKDSSSADEDMDFWL